MLIKVTVAVLIIAAIIVGGIFYNDYMSQSARAESVNGAIRKDKNASAISFKNLEKANNENAGITQNIDKIKEEILKEESVLPDKISPNEIVEDIVSLSEECQVKIVTLSTQEWAKTQINKIEFQVFKISLAIKGPQANIENYVRQQQNSPQKILIIDSLKIDRPLEPEQTDIIANLSLALYSK